MPVRFRQFENINVPVLDNSTNKYLIKYNASSGVFDLVSTDSLIDKSLEDNNVPDSFVTQLEQQIDTENISQQIDIDGGSF